LPNYGIQKPFLKKLGEGTKEQKSCAAEKARKDSGGEFGHGCDSFLFNRNQGTIGPRRTKTGPPTFNGCKEVSSQTGKGAQVNACPKKRFLEKGGFKKKGPEKGGHSYPGKSLKT